MPDRRASDAFPGPDAPHGISSPMPFRPDRIATLYFFHPLRRLLGRKSGGIPILMYHSISDDPEPGRSPYYRTCTDPAIFLKQMEFLSRNGYRTIGMREAVQRLAEQSQVGQTPWSAADAPVGLPPLSSIPEAAPEHPARTRNSAPLTERTQSAEPSQLTEQTQSGPPAELEERTHSAEQAQSGERLVALTFDDGYRDFYTHTFPILARFQYTATMYLPTAYIGDQPRAFNGKPCLSWAEVKELHAAGIEFGSHTVTHPQLRDLPAAAVERGLPTTRHLAAYATA